jgi:AraC-like DNA-binding protein
MERDASTTESEPAVYQYPPFTEATHELVEKQRMFPVSSQCAASGHLDEFYFQDIYFGYTHCSLCSEKLLEFQSCRDYVQMHFSIRCRCTFLVEANTKPFAHFEPHQHNLLYFADKQVRQKIKPEKQLELIIINISRDFLLRYLQNNCPAFLQLKEHICASTPTKLYKANLSITPRIRILLYELLNCPYSGHYKRMFLEAKVVELLMLQLEQCEQESASPAQLKIKEADIEKMHRAREIILKNVENPFSLVELAHQVGTNEYYLKKHFKEVFGTTVFGYLNTYRMEQAKQMLLQGDKKIGDIASALGYKYAAHFTSAFKKHFGYLPQQLKG